MGISQITLPAAGILTAAVAVKSIYSGLVPPKIPHDEISKLDSVKAKHTTLDNIYFEGDTQRFAALERMKIANSLGAQNISPEQEVSLRLYPELGRRAA